MSLFSPLKQFKSNNIQHNIIATHPTPSKQPLSTIEILNVYLSTLYLNHITTIIIYHPFNIVIVGTNIYKNSLSHIIIFQTMTNIYKILSHIIYHYHHNIQQIHPFLVQKCNFSNPITQIKSTRHKYHHYININQVILKKNSC